MSLDSGGRDTFSRMFGFNPTSQPGLALVVIGFVAGVGVLAGFGTSGLNAVHVTVVALAGAAIVAGLGLLYLDARRSSSASTVTSLAVTGTNYEHAVGQLAKNYDVLRNQATQGFVLAGVVMVLGVCVILLGAVGDLFGFSKEGSNLTTAAGIVIEVISGIGFYLFRLTFTQLNATSDKLDDAWKVLAAIDKTSQSQVASDRRDDLLVTLLAKLAGADPPAGPRPGIEAPAGPAESGQALIPYARWKTLHARLNSLFQGDNELHAIREVLYSIVTPFPEKQKLDNPVIDNFFLVYSGDADRRCMIKLQRIRGTSTKPVTDIYCIAEASLPGAVSSVLMWLNAGKMSVAEPRGGVPETWIPIGSPTIDCLIVAHYEQGNPPDGDWLWVDVPKYAVNQARVSVTILSDLPIDDTDEAKSALWEVHRSNWTDVPAAFVRKADGVIIPGRAKIIAEMAEMDGWLAKLQELVTTDANGGGRSPVAALLHDIRTKLGQSRRDGPVAYSALFSPDLFPHMSYFPRQTVGTPVIATYQNK